MLTIGIPVIIAQLLQMSMNFVDTVMAGNLSPQALAAVAVGASASMPIIMFGMGIIMAINPIVSHHMGAREMDDIGKSVRQALWLSQLLAIPFFFLMRNLEPVMRVMNIDPVLIPVADSYLHGLSWGIFAFFAFMALRYFNEGMSITRPGMYIAFIGLLVNIAGNYVFMYGKLGLPAMGAMGCGYASSLVGYVMLASMIIFVARFKSYRRFEIFRHIRRPEWLHLRELIRIGVPIGVSSTMEVTMFALVSLMMGSLGTNIVAGHQVAINFAALSFMVPFGLSTAITTRVGNAKGAGLLHESRFRGFVGIVLSVGFMSLMAIVMFTLPEYIVRIYTQDAEVQRVAVSLLYMAAIFQISDGLQVSGYGALRGLKDTRIPMYVNFVAYWVIGLPLAWLLGFHFDIGPQGLWMGLIAGLTAAALMHNLRFYLLTKSPD